MKRVTLIRHFVFLPLNTSSTLPKKVGCSTMQKRNIFFITNKKKKIFLFKFYSLIFQHSILSQVPSQKYHIYSISSWTSSGVLFILISCKIFWFLYIHQNLVKIVKNLAQSKFYDVFVKTLIILMQFQIPAGAHTYLQFKSA